MELFGEKEESVALRVALLLQYVADRQEKGLVGKFFSLRRELP